MRIGIEHSIDARYRRKAIWQCQLKRNAWRHDGHYNECFILITSASHVTRWNDLSVRVGGWIRPNRFSHPDPLSPSVRVHPLATFLLVIRSASMFRWPLDFHHAERWSITHLPLPWNAQETRVPFVTARNDAALLIVLFTISFHTTRVCVLFIFRGRHIHVSRNSTVSEKYAMLHASLKTAATSYVLYFWNIGL